MKFDTLRLAHDANDYRLVDDDGDVLTSAFVVDAKVGCLLKQARDYDAVVAALTAAREVLNDLAKDTSSNATAMQNKAVTGYMQARDSLSGITGRK